MLGFIIVVLVLAYVMVAGAAKVKIQKTLQTNCGRGHGPEISYYDRCSFTHVDGAIFGGVFWPLVMPFALGGSLADSDKRKADKAKRQKSEIEQRIARASLEKKAIEQERRNLDNSIRNMEIANNIGSR